MPADWVNPTQMAHKQIENAKDFCIVHVAILVMIYSMA